MSNCFWAHSDPISSPDAPGSNWQPLSDHLLAVSELSRELAAAAAPGDRHFQDLASYAGLLHDLGKYSDCFQRMIRGQSSKKCPHAIHGAALAAFPPLQSPQLAYAVAGHHAGLPDRGNLADNIREHLDAARQWLEHARKDCPSIRALFDGGAIERADISSRADLFTRMLFSCLVDADRLDTARRPNTQVPLYATTRLEALLAHIGGLRGGSEAVKEARQEVLAQCLQAAESSDRLLSLSVPTGGGKTLAGMALALKRASLDPNYRRVIVVIPYLSIIEQNAAVYRALFGSDSILEHHSGNFDRLLAKGDERYVHIDSDEKSYRNPGQLPETENWDAPCIVTTSVRFFESLFSNRPSDLRRVHNIARAIVILDEVQVLPRRLLSPLLAIIKELCRDWGCTFILSTATKPAFERPSRPDPALVANPKDMRWDPGTIREIIPNPQSLHTRLKRVSIDWQIAQPVAWSEVASWMQMEPSALCIVNTRDHAQQLFDTLTALSDPGMLFHLSTRMCPAHRLDVISRIRERMSKGLQTRVVSTQLIEAGVDLDFPAVFRAIGPLDSIIQAAGRADREGRLTAQKGSPAGRLRVFLPEAKGMPPNEYKEAVGITQALLGLEPDLQTDDLAALGRYFERYYRDAETGADLLKLRTESMFKTLSLAFEMINSLTRDVFVPYGAGIALIEHLFSQGFLDKSLRRELQPYSVGLQPYEFERSLRKFNQVRDQEIWTASVSSYHPELGLQLGSTEPLII